MRFFHSLIFLSLCSNVANALEKEPRVMPEQGIDKALLGQILFFDTALSRNQTQNCSTCHNPDTAFVDLRENSAQKMVSAGDDPHLFGNRNSPTMLYAKYSPAFYFDEKTQQYIGGQFWDGRAKNLTEQAGGPPLNPLEMGMPSKLEVAKRLASLPMYVGLFMQHYGDLRIMSMLPWKMLLPRSSRKKPCWRRLIASMTNFCAENIN